jgi:hypothetical protein
MLAWLVANGLYRDLISAAILVPIMRVMASKPIQHVKQAVDDLREDMHEQADLHKLTAELKGDDDGPVDGSGSKRDAA